MGKVIESRDGMALVLVNRSSACEGCGARGACHTFGGGRDAKVSVDNEVGAKAGDMVEIGIEEASLLKASFLVYIVPIIALILGAGAGQLVSGQVGIAKEGAAAFGGLLALVGCLIIIRLFDPVFKRYRSMRPKIIRICEG
ncbi:MAG: SoxR reducing system RseC family protein [Deltaproteobacteria bacterium]|uniref:SoxR reducing system RseC family protein n=1 Tax=Candidatus Zymogenus saltonus TaxID=2844893 RepID=A0A9D8KE68_9DELT|nr:SoxR reducing system RseC family protein [Candidatus Zymogenus saltonus]